MRMPAPRPSSAPARALQWVTAYGSCCITGQQNCCRQLAAHCSSCSCMGLHGNPRLLSLLISLLPLGCWSCFAKQLHVRSADTSGRPDKGHQPAQSARALRGVKRSGAGLGSLLKGLHCMPHMRPSAHRGTRASRVAELELGSSRSPIADISSFSDVTLECHFLQRVAEGTLQTARTHQKGLPLHPPPKAPPPGDALRFYHVEWRDIHAT